MKKFISESTKSTYKFNSLTSHFMGQAPTISIGANQLSENIYIGAIPLIIRFGRETNNSEVALVDALFRISFGFFFIYSCKL